MGLVVTCLNLGENEDSLSAAYVGSLLHSGLFAECGCDGFVAGCEFCLCLVVGEGCPRNKFFETSFFLEVTKKTLSIINGAEFTRYRESISEPTVITS